MICQSDYERSQSRERNDRTLTRDGCGALRVTPLNLRVLLVRLPDLPHGPKGGAHRGIWNCPPEVDTFCFPKNEVTA